MDEHAYRGCVGVVLASLLTARSLGTYFYPSSELIDGVVVDVDADTTVEEACEVGGAVQG